MELFFPTYYHKFQCLADACPDSCCKEWTVDVDAESAQRYRQLDGALGDQLRQVLKDTPDGTILTIKDGRCPMWRNDGLCRIQAELGHDALCKTCQEFPRLTHDYGNFIELGLELSCPEAARLILSSPGGLLIQVQTGGVEPEYDQDIMNILRQSRNEALRFLRNAKNIPQALATVLLYAHNVQTAIDLGDSLCFAPQDCLFEMSERCSSGDWHDFFAFFRTLEILTPQWNQRLETAPTKISWSEPLRNLACYMFERYWLQAISDYDLICRVKLAIAACVLVGALGGNTIETAQLFSKEIENNPDNIEAILEATYTSSCLADTNLLALLWL